MSRKYIGQILLFIFACTICLVGCEVTETKTTTAPKTPVVTKVPSATKAPTRAVSKTTSNTPSKTELEPATPTPIGYREVDIEDIVIVDDDIIKATVEKLVKNKSETEYRLVVYVENKGNSDIIVGTVNGYVNNEMTAAVATGNMIKAGKSSRMHILLFGDNLSITSIDEITEVGFDMAVRESDEIDYIDQIKDLNVKIQ